VMSTDCDKSHIRIVLEEKVTDVATSYHWIYIYGFYYWWEFQKLVSVRTAAWSVFSS
jgi:hypothetical protein